jgi:HK97 family phage prohead protease
MSIPRNDEKILRAAVITELRTSDENNEHVVEGYAVLFEQPTKIGDYFLETISRGAIKDDALDDVLFFVNHDSSKISLARSRRNNANSSLQLKVDERGLYFKTKLDIENNTEAAALYSAIKRGDVDGMSFWMRVNKDEWSDLNTETPKRRITEISKIFEISAVNWPAYENTEIYARSNKDTLDNDKKALENARSTELDNAADIAEAKRKQLMFKVQNRL